MQIRQSFRKMPKIAAIENNVPIPARAAVTSYGDEVDLISTLRKLTDGQSFVVDGGNGRERALHHASRLGILITTKKEPDGRFRVWRKPKEEQ